MIYTIGHKANYLAAIMQHGVIQKAAGGYAFKTEEDAQRRIEEVRQQGNWVIWGVDGDWDTHTELAPDGWWRLLIEPRSIIPLVSE